MSLSKLEKYWLKKSAWRLLATIVIYSLWGDELAVIVQGLDGLNPIASHIIVFGILGFLISYVIYAIDEDKVGRKW